MQLVHEAALCTTGVRQQRCLRHRGFELANGLPFVATDQAIHCLLDAHTIAEAEALQVALGRIRQASGHFRGELLAIDPHRLRSYSKRRMRMRKAASKAPTAKTTQTFFCLDTQTHQPLCLTIGTSAPTVAKATPPLLAMATKILPTGHRRPLVLADCEHFTKELIEPVYQAGAFDLLIPMPNQPYLRKRLEAIPAEQFSPRWAGLATTKIPYRFSQSDTGPFYLLAQRCGETQSQYRRRGFFCTSDRDEVEALTAEYPQRWHVEEFFNAHQALGWKRAGTQNLHIQYGKMTMALLAQAALHQLRARLGEPSCRWDAEHLAKSILQGLDGDIRVCGDTIVVTYYNAGSLSRSREQFEGLPSRMTGEGIDPRIPWLYDFKLDFRFK